MPVVYKLESIFERDVRAILNMIPKCYHFKKEAKALRGLPDLLICYKGYFLGWELKRSEQEASKSSGRIVLQKHQLGLIQKAEGVGRIVHPNNFEYCLMELLSL